MVLGLVFDNSAGTSPAGVLVGIAVGVVVGCIGFWLRVRSALRD
jgi:F0F1-type ATP synthase assembly protein I